jgi:hypothetical protein
MRLDLLKKGLLVFFIATLCACGGGSSGDTGRPAPTPQIPLPTVNLSTNAETVLSGGNLFIIVSGEPIESTSTTVEFSCPTDIVLSIQNNSVNILDVEISLPVVSVLTEYDCAATMTNSESRTATSTLKLTVLPENEIGRVVGKFDPHLELMLPGYNMLGINDSPGSHVLAITQSAEFANEFQVKAIEGSSLVPRSYDRDDFVLIEGSYASIDFLQSPSLNTHGLPDTSLSIVSEKEDKIYWLIEDFQTRVYSVQETIDVERPCFLHQTNTLFANDMIVGQIDLGLTVFDVDNGSESSNTNNFEATPVQNIGVGRSLCHALRGLIPSSVINKYPDFGTFSGPGDFYAAPLTAIDFNALELVYYGDGNGDNRLEELGSVPIETNSTSDLNIIQVISRGGPTQSPAYMLVLLSDNKHLGEHRILQINFDENTHEFNQEILYEWSEGIPISMQHGVIGGSTEGGLLRADLAVVLRGTEDSFFFDNLLGNSDNSPLPPLYDQPTFFKVGLGAGSAVIAESPDAPSLEDSGYGILVSYPESGEVVYISQ